MVFKDPQDSKDLMGVKVIRVEEESRLMEFREALAS
jgi:hypothetical protein